MLPFLSDAWIAALDEAAAADERLRELTAGLSLVVEQRITDGDDGSGEVVYHVSVDDGTVRVATGAAAAPDVRFSQDRETASGIASGRVSAQRAFMAGRLQVGGDLQLLVERGDVLAALNDAFVGVRAVTEGLDESESDPDHPL